MKNFWYLFVAYTVIWTTIFGYITHLSKKNRELREELHELQAQIDKLLSQKEAS